MLIVYCCNHSQIHFKVSLCDFILKFFDNAVTFHIFLRCVILAQSTNGLGSFVNISRSRSSPVERLRDISSGASRFVQHSTQIE